MGGGEFTVRLLQVAEVHAYLQHVAEVDADSGIAGASHSHPYGAAEAFDYAAGQDREVHRWTTPITEPD